MIRNAVPKRYRTKFIEPGLADYTAEGFGIVLVSKDTLDRMLPSFVGKPVFLEHQDVSPEEAFQNNGDSADGVVSDVGYDEDSGWYYADMMIWNDETQRKIDSEGYTVSCAYDVGDADGTGGKYHNIDFNQSVLDGEYTHMAIVNNPRYEGATILRNSKGAKPMAKIFKFLGKKEEIKNQEPEEKKPEEEIVNADSAMVDLGDGEQVPLSDLVAAYKETSAESETVMNAEDEVDVDGEKVKVGDMINAYRNKCAPSMQNVEPPQDIDAEDVVDEKKQMQNSVKKEEGKKNFQKVENAVRIDVEPIKPILNTKSERLERGKDRYTLKEAK